MVSQKVVSWWKYNPILQKPTSLDPVKPWSWFWYYGPDPASGCSYGQYHDADYDFDMLSAKKNVVYSPASGKPMEMTAEVPADEIKSQFSKATADSGIFQTVCNSCEAELRSDYPLGDLGKFYCCDCGKEITVATIATIQLTEKKTMTKETRDLKRKIRANVLEKREATDRRRVRAEEVVEEKKDDEDELISLDSIMQAMEDEGGVDEVEEVETEAYVGEEQETEMLAEEESEEPTEEVKEPELDAAPEKDEEEYYDLDMVLSMINKKQKLAKRKAKAEQEKEIEKEKCDDADLEEKEEDVVEAEEEEEVKEEVKEEEVKEPKVGDETGKEPDMLVQESPLPAQPAEMAAMKFEPLATLAALASVRKEDIDMALYGEETQNPIWNVTVAGVPTARIQLKSQMHPEEIRSVFCSDDYAKDLMIHCEKTGFVSTMNKVKAEFWSNYTSNQEIATRFQKEANASFGLERKKLLATFKQDFRNCINIVSAGLSKNFYPDMGNPLKEHMFTNLRTVGLPEQTAISCVEKSFAEGSAPYFNALFEKAEDYMNLSSDARKEIAAAISHGATIEQSVGSELENASPSTLSERLAQASVVASMTGSSPLVVNKELVMDTNEYKQQLRNAWRK